MCIRYSLCLNKDGKSKYANVLDMTLDQYRQEHYGPTFHDINQIEAALTAHPSVNRPPVAPPTPALNHKSTANNLHNGI